ncbi:DEAD/DEAH box helicase [Paenibacillus antibioticophila]|uniref:DEAD/DEAH box helicase n=1 Tax=Paenibacillus antibioticophila TaxID=1274374 RepID=A0A919XYB6_9BACL|nr:DEAD/DEAH box helicase [Paenibacillus antibioticophila]GIO38842.1 DEAD/DEAH box helicase [Paenibacillus antibioticophila]
MSLFRNRIRGGNTGGPQKPTDPTEIFKTLIHQEGYDYLRDIQKEFLKLWHGKRNQRDVVGILNTGAGKTLIGQLMLLSKMNEGVGPVVYLCPDKQLVQQAIDQAAIHNIPVVEIEQDPNQAAEFPIEFLNGKAILITTFERMFNGRSIFGVDGYGYRSIQEIGALVIDDAHSCIKKARQQSTILIDRGHNAYAKLYRLFEASIREQGEGALTAIKAGESTVSRLVPYWVWRQHKDTVLKVLQQMYEQDDPVVRYTWGIIGDELSKCQCYISGRQIEITPLQIPVERVPSFFNAKHRFILSATFNNNTDLITELGIDRSSVAEPLEVDNQGDAGERLVIAPKRYFPDLTDEAMRPFIVEYAKKHNVVVIVPNGKKAKAWEKYKPTFVDKDNIVWATQKLKESKGNLMVFLNRYDGVDLAGDSCRILVLDGLPNVHTARERYISVIREGSPFLNAQTAQTIEQGLGRAVRSGSDHCAVFILDNSLLSFIGVDTNRPFFAPATRKQIDFGLKLFGEHTPTSADEAMKEIVGAIDACLSGDPEWRQFHKDMILAAERDDKSETSHLLDIAETEHSALLKYRDDFNEDACGVIRDMLNTQKDHLSKVDEAYYMQMGATLLDEVNPVGAADMQVKARSLFSKVLKPQHHTYSKLTKVKGKQADLLVKWLKQFSNGTDVIIAIETLYSDLIYSPDVDSFAFEKSVHKIGEFLGFTSQMPEEDEGDGPDNLWRLENGVNLIIEAKNNSTNDRVSRSEIEQLLHSIQWHNDKYGSEQQYIPIMMHKGSKSFENAHPSEDSRVMSESLLKQFKDALSKLAKALSQKSPQEWTVAEVQGLLASYGLLYNQIIDKYTAPLR